MQQVFIAKSPELADELAFDRKLFVIRKLVHTAIRAANVDGHWYVASISARTIVYGTQVISFKSSWTRTIHD